MQLQEAINSTLPQGSQIQDLSVATPRPLAPHPKQLSPAAMKQLGMPSAARYADRKADVVTDSERFVPIIYPGCTLEAAVQQLKAELPQAPPLRYDWRSFAYTDGSCRQKGTSWAKDSPGLGTGVYIPARGEQEGTETCISIIPLSSAGS
jgi:hypothetical protein